MAYELIDEGKYRAKAKSAEFGENKNGTPFVMLTFEVSDGNEWAGTQVSDRFYLSDAAAARTIEGMRYAGCVFPGADITNTEGLGSCECEIVIEHEDGDNGRTYYRIKWINSLGFGRGVGSEERLDGGRKKAFASKLRGLVLATQPKGKSMPADDRPEGNPGINDSDIPF